MSPTFLQAAASYFGINPEQIAGSDWHNADGQLVVSFEFSVSEDDLLGIADRMKALRESDVVTAQVEVVEPPSNDEHRQVWNAMDKAARGRFGSFARFVAAGGAELAKAPQEEFKMPDYVYLPRSETTEYQRQVSHFNVTTGSYMVQVDDLTDEQRKKLQ